VEVVGTEAGRELKGDERRGVGDRSVDVATVEVD
jgi:hypothetical protein